MHQLAAVFGGDDHAAGEIFRELRFRVGVVRHVLRQCENFLVVKCIGLQFGKAEFAAHKTRRHHELNAEFRHVIRHRLAAHFRRLADVVKGVGVQQRANFYNIGRMQVVFAFQRQRGIGAGVQQVANRIRFDRDLIESPLVAERAGHGGQIHFIEFAAGVRAEQPVRAFVNAPRADKAAARERGGGDAADPGPARMHALVPCAVGAVL